MSVPEPIEPEDVAAALQLSVGMLFRRMRQTKPDDGDLTIPESTALSRLERGGPTTSAELARTEQISPQSMGATLAALVDRGLVERSPDPDDGRRQLLRVSDAGRAVMHSRRSARTRQFTDGLSQGFSARELTQLAAAAPLLQKLAEKL